MCYIALSNGTMEVRHFIMDWYTSPSQITGFFLSLSLFLLMSCREKVKRASRWQGKEKKKWRPRVPAFFLCPTVWLIAWIANLARFDVQDDRRANPFFLKPLVSWTSFPPPLAFSWLSSVRRVVFEGSFVSALSRFRSPSYKHSRLLLSPSGQQWLSAPFS